jgi:hypothetical protein
MKTKKQIIYLMHDHMWSKCNDSCLYGTGICKFEKRCDIIYNNYKKAKS